MRIALISDIHGNCVALEAVLADIRRKAVDRIVCLGDVAQSGPQPGETLARLRALACPVVLGNADAWLLSGDPSLTTDTWSEAQQAIRAWSYARLSDEDRTFMGGFRPAIEVPLSEAMTLLCFHGSPTSFNDLILPTTPEEEFQRLLGRFRSHLCAGGHTHWQHLRRLGSSFFVNPGSVGWAYDRYAPAGAPQIDPWAEYAVVSVDSGQWSVECCRVPFGVHEYARVIRASGRPYGEELIARLSRALSS